MEGGRPKRARDKKAPAQRGLARARAGSQGRWGRGGSSRGGFYGEVPYPFGCALVVLITIPLQHKQRQKRDERKAAPPGTGLCPGVLQRGRRSRARGPRLGAGSRDRKARGRYGLATYLGYRSGGRRWGLSRMGADTGDHVAEGTRSAPPQRAGVVAARHNQPAGAAACGASGMARVRLCGRGR
jgi:hypothetical protein